MSPEDSHARQTLVARLSGPLQSWGEHSPYTQRGTLPYPTYSGLLGLARAALGSSREADPASWSWLRTLAMAIRIDTPGSVARDFHTVNPPPSGSWDSAIGAKRKSSKANQTPYIVPMGNGRAWAVGKTPSTLITERHYVADAAFTWLVEGPAADIERLTAALRRPKWQLSLGRKACPPDWPLLLGTSKETLVDLASMVPVADPSPRSIYRPWEQADLETPVILTRHVELQMLTAMGAIPVTGGTSITHTDDPVGSHPHAGHTPRVRHISTVSAPVSDRLGLLVWATTHLDST